MEIDSRTRVFLYQLVGTWGQLLFPRPWKEFRLWYDTHKSKGMKPVLDGMVMYAAPSLPSFFGLKGRQCTLASQLCTFAGYNRMVQKNGRKNLDSMVY